MNCASRNLSRAALRTAAAIASASASTPVTRAPRRDAGMLKFPAPQYRSSTGADSLIDAISITLATSRMFCARFTWLNKSASTSIESPASSSTVIEASPRISRRAPERSTIPRISGSDSSTLRARRRSSSDAGFFRYATCTSRAPSRTTSISSTLLPSERARCSGILIPASATMHESISTIALVPNS